MCDHNRRNRTQHLSIGTRCTYHCTIWDTHFRLRLRLHDNAGGENATKSFRMHGSFTRYEEQNVKVVHQTGRKPKRWPSCKVEEFENGNVLPDKFECVNSRNGMLASCSVTFIPFSAVHTDPAIQKIVFTFEVQFSSCDECCFVACFECDWCFHDNTWHMTNFCGSFAPV